MKKRFLSVIITLLCVGTSIATNLVILHTNDTHSQIDPDEKNRGGALRHKAIIDSVRATQPNVLLIDAGDAVQGTLYFNVFNGEVEQRIMNHLDYDIRIVGNHEFDNGVESLASCLKNDKSTLLTSNYQLCGTSLEGMFENYTIKEFEGKRIGFIGINTDPVGMIAEGNYNGIKYLDAVTVANKIAQYLKKDEKVDLVVAITHIGYNQNDTTLITPGDVQLATQSHDIDLIIGGHSHDTITPTYPKFQYRVANADGDSVTIVQAAKAGLYIGEITINLDNMDISPRLITVDSRWDNNIDSTLAEIIDYYRTDVDSIMRVKVAESAVDLFNDQPNLQNFLSDFVHYQGELLIKDSIDLAIANKGGIRRSIEKGDITEGEIIMTFPFNSYIRVITLNGSDLRAALDVMARRGGDCVSHSADVTYDPGTGKCIEITINGTPLDENKTYRIATLNYLANGGDYMEPLRNGETITQSRQVMYADILDYLRKLYSNGEQINPENSQRMRPSK